jgi:hypothetical protein
MSHIPADELTWKCKRHRNGDEHANNCTTGYRVKDECNIHHVLSVTCLQDKNMPPAQLEYIRACLKITDWNINSGDNNIGLPMKSAYANYENGAVKPPVVAWNGHACHQTDHDLYIGEVIDKLKIDVYDNLEAAKKDKNCEIINAKAIEDQLNKISSHYRKHLTKKSRAKILDCWNKRGTLATWYIPFSMATAPRARQLMTVAAGKKVALDSILQQV